MRCARRPQPVLGSSRALLPSAQLGDKSFDIRILLVSLTGSRFWRGKFSPGQWNQDFTSHVRRGFRQIPGNRPRRRSLGLRHCFQFDTIPARD